MASVTGIHPTGTLRKEIDRTEVHDDTCSNGNELG